MNEIIERKEVKFSQEEIDTIKSTVAKDASDTELKLFLHQCKRTGLDPFSRQIYFFKVGGKASIQSSIDGFRLIAERSGKYQGQTLPLYMDDAGKWSEVWMSKSYPVAAKVGVHRSDFKEPLYAIAKWSSYCPMYNGTVGTMWNKMPEVMIAKVAEALALRKAFPNDLSGIYAQEEMVQAELVQTEVYDTTPIAKDAVPTITYDASALEMESDVTATDAPAVIKNPTPWKKPTAKKARVLSETEQQKVHIKSLCDAKALVPVETKEEYEQYVLLNTGLDLAPENYAEIITKLEALQ